MERFTSETLAKAKLLTSEELEEKLIVIEQKQGKRWADEVRKGLEDGDIMIYRGEYYMK